MLFKKCNNSSLVIQVIAFGGSQLIQAPFSETVIILYSFWCEFMLYTFTFFLCVFVCMLHSNLKMATNCIEDNEMDQSIPHLDLTWPEVRDLLDRNKSMDRNKLPSVPVDTSANPFVESDTGRNHQQIFRTIEQFKNNRCGYCYSETLWPTESSQRKEWQ